MPDDVPPPEATLQLTVRELDEIFADARPSGEANTDSELEAGYHVGQIDAAVAMHRKIIDEADIILE